MRVFVGIALPSELQDRLSDLQSGVAGARWLDPGNLHMTLRFVGDVSEAEATELDAELSLIQDRAFELHLSGVGAFERKRRVHSLWAGVEKSEALVHLQAKVEQTVVRAGFEPEGRKYKPHITVARLKRGAARDAGTYMESHNAFAAGPVRVHAFTLFQSHLNRDGARYEALAEYPLVSL